jgi:hypothetical protein
MLNGSSYNRRYVAMDVHYTENGNITPTRLYWDDGKSFEIDRVTDVRPGVSLKVGASGLRYTCLILGKERCIYLSEGKWFVET